MLVALTALMVAPAYGMKIYNMAAGLTMPADFDPLESSVFVNQPNTYLNQNTFDETLLDSTLSTLSTGEFVMFNVESYSTETEVFDYFINPSTAISLRQQLVDYVSAERPDLTFCMYKLPGGMGDAFGGTSAQEKAWIESEEAFRVVTNAMPALCVRGAWDYTADPANSWEFRAWRTKMLNAVAMSQLVHGQKPLIVLSNRVGNNKSKPLIPYDILQYQLEFCEEYDLDVVFWGWPSDPASAYPWGQKLLLHAFGSL
jgi:hypothetical protein